MTLWQTVGCVLAFVSLGSAQDTAQPLVPVAEQHSVVRPLLPNDRIPETYWLTAGQWHQVGLGRLEPVSAVVLTWLLPMDHEGIYRVETSPDGVLWSERARGTVRSPGAATPPLEQRLALLPEAVRYVRVVGRWLDVPPVWQSLVAVHCYRGPDASPGTAPDAPQTLRLSQEAGP